MTTWDYVVRMARFRPVWFVLSGALAGGMMYAFPLVPGLVARQFLDNLADTRQLGLQVWLPLGLLILAGLIRAATTVGAVTAERGLQLIVGMLLRRNIFAHVLRQPGAQ